MLTIRFRGLCMFVEGKTSTDVYLLDTAAIKSQSSPNEHLTSLAIPVTQINTRSTNWLPTAIVDTADGPQLGVWRLEPKQVLTNEPVGNTKPPSWDRSVSIDFRFQHKDDNVSSLGRDDATKAGAAVVVLTDGELTIPDLVQDKIDLKRDTVVESRGPFARSVTWTRSENQAFKIASGGRTIQLLANAAATLTNAAPVPSGTGLEHFKHYYDHAFKKLPRANRKLSLQPRARARDDVPVYDCIPPTGGPDPEP